MPNQKIIFLPTSRNNPYQSRLAEELEEYGNCVFLSDSCKKLPILIPVFWNWKPDILHLHWTHTFIKSRNRFELFVKCARTILEIVLVKAIGIKIAWTLHNLSDHDSEHNVYEDMMHRCLFRLSDAVFVHCKTALSHVSERFKLGTELLHKTVVVPHGNYDNCYENSIDPKTAKDELGLPSDSLVFGFFGNIRKYKGLDRLVSSFSMLQQTNTRLLIAGRPSNNSTKKSLEEAAKRDKRIMVYPEFIDNQEIQLFFNAIDVVVLPFQTVLTSGSVMLAITFGKPIITPKAGCISDIFQVDEIFLYDFSDDKALLMAMKNSINTDIKRWGERNRVIAEKYQFKDTAQLTDRAYSGLSQ
jgi:glycosyltransferase involved in cell wall biosynthesis